MNSLDWPNAEFSTCRRVRDNTLTSQTPVNQWPKSDNRASSGHSNQMFAMMGNSSNPITCTDSTESRSANTITATRWQHSCVPLYLTPFWRHAFNGAHWTDSQRLSYPAFPSELFCPISAPTSSLQQRPLAYFSIYHPFIPPVADYILTSGIQGYVMFTFPASATTRERKSGVEEE